MSENHREPEVPEARVPVVECLDGPARITSKELAPIQWKVAPSRMLVPQVREWMQVWEKCSYAHRQVDEQPSKRSKNNGDKSAVGMLKITRQLGCVRQDMEPPKSSSILWKISTMWKPIRCFRLTEAVLRHANIRYQNPSFGMTCPGDPHQRNPDAPKIWGSVSGRDRVARAMCPRSSVGQTYLKIKGETSNNILLTFGKLVPACINS